MWQRVIAFIVMVFFGSASLWSQSSLELAVGLVNSITGDLEVLDSEISELRGNLTSAENSLIQSEQSRQDLERTLNGKEQLLGSLDELLQKRENTLDQLSALLEKQQQQYLKSRQKSRFWLIVLGILSAGLMSSTIGLAISK